MAPVRRSMRTRKKKVIPDMGFPDIKSLTNRGMKGPVDETEKKKTTDEVQPVVPRVGQVKPEKKTRRRQTVARVTVVDKVALIQDVIERVVKASAGSISEKEQLGMPIVVRSKRGRKPKSKQVDVVSDEQASAQLVLEQREGPLPTTVKRGRGRPRKNPEGPIRPKRQYRKRVKFQEAPPENLSKDELEDRIFNEEIQKLSDITEVMRLSKGQYPYVDSDDESIDGDRGYIMLDDSDVEENIIVTKEGDSTCPRPAPRKGRGGHKYLKRNMDSAVSQEEVHNMCQILRNSMITSLSGTGIISTTSDCGPFTMAEGNLESDSIEVMKNGSEMVMYGKLWKNMTAQQEWLKKQFSSCLSDPVKFAKQTGMHQLRNGFNHQVYIEHLSCLAVLAKEPKAAIIQNGMLAWFPEFDKMYRRRYTELQDYESGFRALVNKALLVATLKVCTTVGEVLENLIYARSVLVELMDLVDCIYYDKRQICMEFERVHDRLQLRHARFDESSVWGMKPIRLALEPPYFKTEDGLLAAPLVPYPLREIKDYSMCFFKRDKQKWTTKDLQQLKACIKETLYAKRMSILQDRYEVLMADCVSQYELDMKREGRLDAPSLETKRRRGRPKKSDLELTEKYGIIYPVIAVLPNGTVVRNKVSPRLLSEWRTAEEKKLKTKSYDELVFLENERIDWEAVACKMVLKSRKHRNAEDCELAFVHEVHPLVNDKRWGAEESRRLKEIYERVGNDWPAIAKELSTLTPNSNRTQRTAYQCFFRVRNRIEPPRKLAWNETLDKQVLQNLKEHPGNWRLVAAKIDDPASTKRQVIERYKKTINPVLRNGAFTRVEDCLLILTIEKLKPFLAREGHFGCLVAYLPWRCETTWRDRANNLFSDWIVPWTLEEDQMLLELAKTMNRNWQKISEEFTSFKNRKGCLTRFKILKRRLKDKRFNNSLEAYHEAYAMTRYNVFQYKHLKEILELLTKVQNKPLPEEHMTFVGLVRDREPSEVRLQHMLLTFDKGILASAISSLRRYVETRDEYWKNWIITHGKRKRTFDRRTFHPENPQSVASALHIRGLALKKKENISNLSDFEDEIYKFYARFKRTKALNPETDRPYIPDAKTLAEWPSVSRLIDTPLDNLEDVPVKRKWKSLKSERSEASSAKQPGGRAKANVKKRKVSTKALLKSKRRRKSSTKKKLVDESIPLVDSSAEEDPGYIIIPHLEHPKRERSRSLKKDADPEFIAVLKTEPINDQSGLRRSMRGSAKKWSYFNENDDSEVDEIEL